MTVTAVQPPGRFGALQVEGESVAGFIEKPEGDGGWINGDFFVLEPSVLETIKGDATTWELEPLKGLSAKGELHAYRHMGFWQPMDTMNAWLKAEAREESWDWKVFSLSAAHQFFRNNKLRILLRMMKAVYDKKQ